MKTMTAPTTPSLLCLDEDILVFGVQHTFTDELLSDWDGNIVGHTQVRQIVQEPAQIHTSSSVLCNNKRVIRP